MTEVALDWRKHEDGQSHFAETTDGFIASYTSNGNAWPLGYSAHVITPENRFHGATCASVADARSWARETIAKKRAMR